jgi:hypothetical protein
MLITRKLSLLGRNEESTETYIAYKPTPLGKPPHWVCRVDMGLTKSLTYPTQDNFTQGFLQKLN